MPCSQFHKQLRSEPLQRPCQSSQVSLPSLPVFGAGNDGLNDDTGEDVPSDFGYDIILPVAASTTGDEIALFSNYGRHSVLLAAPGTSIVSTVPNSRYFVYAVRLPILVPFPPC